VNQRTAPAPVATRPASEDEAPRTLDDLRVSVPDLKTRPSPPALWITPFFGMHIPYQIGVGVGVDVWATAWLRLGLLYSFGVSPSHEGAKLSHYGEGLLSLRLLHFTRETIAEVSVTVSAMQTPTLTRVIVPAHHSWYIEGGLLSGFIGPARCVANCTDPSRTGILGDDSRQLVMPFGGVRYVYFHSQSSERAAFNEVTLAQVYAHLFTKPINAPAYDLFRWNGERVEQTPLGFRVGFDAPPFGGCLAKYLAGIKCAQGGLALGLNPLPQFVFFEFHVTYPIY